MDNFNNMQGQPGNPYANGQPQYNPYVNGQNQYSPYANSNQQYNPYGQPVGTYNQYPQANTTDVTTNKKSFITLSLILGVIGSIILFVGLMLPAIDFSHFHKEVDIQYNLFKVGKNVGLISSMWNVIPYAILISILILLALSFIRIPVLKVLPVVLILCMFVLMLADMGNVAKWATETLDKVGIVLEKKVTAKEIFKSLMPGIYIMVVGTVIALVSCFVKVKDN